METKETQLQIEGVHPYYAHLGRVAIEVPLLSAVPGNVVPDRGKATVEELRDEEAWTPIAGPFRRVAARFISVDAVISDHRALLSLLWDLQGEPIHPSLGERVPLPFVAVGGEGEPVMIYRRTREMWSGRHRKLDEMRSTTSPKVLRSGARAA